MVLLAPYMKEIKQMYNFSVEALLCNELVSHSQFGKAENVMDLWKNSTMEMAYLLGNKTNVAAKKLKDMLEGLMTKYEYHLERNIRVAIHNSLEEKEDEPFYSEILR